MPSSQPADIQGDLAYVRRAVDQRRFGSPTPLPLAALWSAGLLIGFGSIEWGIAADSQAILRFANYWFMGAIPLLLVLTLIVEGRQRRRSGEVDRRTTFQDAMYWAGFTAAMAIVYAMAFTGRLPNGLIFIQIILTLVGLAVFSNSVFNQQRLWMIMGAVFMLGAVALFFVYQGVWIALGLIFTATCFATADYRGTTNTPISDGT